MNVTNNLKLPQYTEEDIFDLQDINKAYDSIDKAYKEVIDFKNEIPKTNATAEVIDARGGKETLGKRLDEFDSQLETNTKNIKDISSYVTLEMFKLNVEVDYTNALITALNSGKSIKGDKTKVYNISKTCEINNGNIIIEDLVISPTAKIECFRLNNVNNITFRNNIFNISSLGGFAIGGIGKNITIENNVFNGGSPSIYIGDTSTWSNPTMSDNIIVKNNIYVGLGALGGGGSFCSVQNCDNLIFDGNIGSNGSEFLDANNNILHVTCTNNISTNFNDNHYDFNSCKRVIFSKNQVYQNTTFVNRLINFTDFSSGSALNITCDDIIVSDNIVISTLASTTQYSISFGIGASITLSYGRIIKIENNKFDLGGGSISISPNILNKVNISNNLFKNIPLITTKNTDGLIMSNTFEGCERLDLQGCIRNIVNNNNFIECNSANTTSTGSFYLNGCSNCLVSQNYCYNSSAKTTFIGSANGGTNTYIHNKAINNTNIVRSNPGDIVVAIPTS